MRNAVKTAFTAFQQSFEGWTNWLYCDVENFVTTGIGNLVDPVGVALALPWLREDLATPATQSEIAAEWNLVKSRTELNKLGGGAYRLITKLRLKSSAVDALVLSVASRFESALTRRFPEYANWPADAQMGILSIAWPEGPYFFTRYPRFSAAADRLDFAVCADESAINPVARYELRNKASAMCFNNAARVVLAPELYSPDVLYWPRDLTADGY